MRTISQHLTSLHDISLLWHARELHANPVLWRSARYDMLDNTARSSGVEELVHEVDGWSLRVPHVSAPNFPPAQTNLTRLHALRLLWGISCVFLGVYAIVQNLNVPLIVQPQIMSALSYVSWAQASSQAIFCSRLRCPSFCLRFAVPVLRQEEIENNRHLHGPHLDRGFGRL